LNGAVTRDRNPSGFPNSPIVKPIYGTRDFDVNHRIGGQHAGFLRVRRSLLISSGVVSALVVWVAVAGKMSSATGMASVMLAPLLLILAGTHLAVIVTRPKQDRTRTDRS
jgi:hypothetical protein